MNTKLKKILIIFISVLILALIGLLIYNLFIKEPEKDGLSPGELPEGEEGGLEPGEEEGEITPKPELKIKAISTERVLSPTLSADNTKVIYYSQYNGNVWQSAFDGSGLMKVSSAALDNLKDIIWSPDKTKVISIYQDEEENISKYSYNYNTGKVFLLDSFIQEIIWSPQSDKIVYQYTNETTDDNNISTANPDGANWQSIFQTRMKNINLSWAGSEITFYEKPSGLIQGSLFILNPLTKNLTKVLSDVYGMAAKWSPQGDNVLYSKTGNQGKGIGLYIAPKDGSGEIAIGISGLIEKCVWSQDNRTIFCAVSSNIDEAEILPDDFYKGSFISNDEFWKINLETGEKTILLEPWERGDGIYDAVDLFLSPLEDYLFFVSKLDGLLYSIGL